VLTHEDNAIRLDLLDEDPIPEANLATSLVALSSAPNDVLYVSFSRSSGTVTKQLPVLEKYQWPQIYNARQAVFINTALGIKTLHTLAEIGGIRNLITTKEAGKAGLPTLPL